MRLPCVLLLIVTASARATSPADAVMTAYKDALRLPAKDRVYCRYLWWPDGWDHQALLTKAQQSLLSDQGEFPNPVHVGRGVFRIDTRESGWDKRLPVWERFKNTDPFFHVKWKFEAEATVSLYFPPGSYDGKEFGPTAEQRKFSAGSTLARPALWANPWVDVGPDTRGRAHDELRAMLYTEAPVLMAPWFIVQTQRQTSIRNVNEKTGYHDFLGIANRNDVFKLVGLDEKAAIERFQEWRAVVEQSGISQQNRQIVLLRATTGLVWGTLDTFKEQGRGVAKTNLRRGEFDHDAEEWIYHLPNGLPGTALVNAKDDDKAKTKAGDLVESAPDKIGPDDSALNPSRDHRVHENISCWRCHGVDKDFVKPFDDWVRRTHRKNRALLRDPDKKVDLELRSNYLRDVERLTKIDREEYANAVARMTSTGELDPGFTVSGFTRIYCELWNKYVSERVTLEKAAAELGVGKEKYLLGLRAYQDKLGKSDLVQGVFLLDPPGTLSRLEWEDRYGFAQAITMGLAIPEVGVDEKKVKP